MDLDLGGVGKVRKTDTGGHHSKSVVEILEEGEFIKTVFPNENPMGEFSRGWKHPYHL